MKYAIRLQGERRTLVEMESMKNSTDAASYMPVPAYAARDWVKSGKEHETGLWVDDGKVRYAEPQS
jgi:hypothetical protein